jgi:hypothetical protein
VPPANEDRRARREAIERWEDERERSERKAANAGRKRTLYLGGRWAYLGVEDDQLVAAEGRNDGLPGRRESLPRALPDVESVVWVRSCGTLTAAALTWLRDEGIPFTRLDETGRVLASSTPDVRQARG